MTITADAASRAVALASRRQRTQRRLPAIAPTIARFAAENQIYIFNVGPWDHHVMMGSWGDYYVPACASDKPYAPAPPIPGIYHEPIPVNEANFQMESIEGGYIADQILGVGKNLSWNTSLVKLGVFKSSTPIPTKEELEEARANLHAEFTRLFEEAELAFAQGPKEFQQVVGDGMKHKLAARELGRADAQWVQSAVVGKRVACPNCGEFSDPHVISCPKCTYIFDLDRYKAEIEPRLAKGRAGR